MITVIISSFSDVESSSSLSIHMETFVKHNLHETGLHRNIFLILKKKGEI
jgi:hypothetical protein